MPNLRFRYQTIEFGNTDIHVRTLRDNQEFSDAEDVASNLGISSANWSLFGVLWASGEILARLMYDYDIKDKRILEIGCGIALSSLILKHRQADITATDYHPEAENFLLENARLNNCKPIPFVRTGWNDDISDLGKFDTIIGSDVLYERGHAELLADFINQHAKPNCTIIIIDPGRKHHARFSKKMISLGYTHSQSKSEHIDELTIPVQGYERFQTLSYHR